MRPLVAIVALSALPATAMAQPRPQIVPQIEIVGVFAKRATVSIGAELAVSGRFDVRPHSATGRVHDVFARVRWDPVTGQAQAGGGLRAGVNGGGTMPAYGGWTPGLLVAGEVGAFGRRFGGPTVGLGLVTQTTLAGGHGAGGLRAGLTLRLRDDVDPHVAAWNGRIEEVELAVRGGAFALQSRNLNLLRGGAGQTVPPRDFD